MWRDRSAYRYYHNPERTLVSAIGDAVHTVLVVPQIQSISTQTSGILGRQELVITGSGFAASDGTCKQNVVSLSGVPCAVTSCSASEIRCGVGPQSMAGYVASAPFPSTFGLYRRTSEYSPLSLVLLDQYFY